MGGYAAGSSPGSNARRCRVSRLALCGFIQHYGDEAPICLASFRSVLLRTIALLPFSIYQHEDELPLALLQLEAMVRDGRLHARETIHVGLDALPETFLAMLRGAGIGKHLVQLAD